MGTLKDSSLMSHHGLSELHQPILLQFFEFNRSRSLRFRAGGIFRQKLPPEMQQIAAFSRIRWISDDENESYRGRANDFPVISLHNHPTIPQNQPLGGEKDSEVDIGYGATEHEDIQPLPFAPRTNKDKEPIEEPLSLLKPNYLLPSRTSTNNKIREKMISASKLMEIFRNLHFELSFGGCSHYIAKREREEKRKGKGEEREGRGRRRRENEKGGRKRKMEGKREEREREEYAFLADNNKLPVIIAKDLSDDEKTALIKVLKSRKQAIAWKLSDIKGINLEFCSHKILMEDDYEPAVQHQRRVNLKIYDVIKKEVEKLLDAGLIYPISDSPWVSPVHCVPKKGGMTVVTNDDNELVPTRLVTGWRVCIDYRKLNEATRKDHFPLSFMDQMLERLAGNEYYCFLDGFSGYFKIPIDPND
ncbi:hypothetical protein Tco_1575050 [Tanacetum coccineum]